jgi:hydrogenase nickel incorporation protein HypA/HybF
MHELSIALSMIDSVLEHATRQGDVHVEAVHLKIGALSGVDIDSLEFSYGIACEDTPLQGSRLIIEQVPIVIFCPTCGFERTPRSPQKLCCPECQSSAFDIRSGRELDITALEIS